MIRRLVWLALGVSVLTGCAVSHKSPGNPTALLPDRSSEVSVGQMERAAVRRQLGEPRFSSAYWGFDLFRADVGQAELVFAVTPWPVPFARFKDELQRYTLVTYDTNDLVSAVATGIFRRPTSWRKVSPIANDFPSLHLRAGELMFFVDPEGTREANLLVLPRGRDAYLRQVCSSGFCTVVMGCGGRGCADQLKVDGGPIRRLPLRTAYTSWLKKGEQESWLEDLDSLDSDPKEPWTEALVCLVCLKLTGGEHVLEFSGKHLGGKTFYSILCRPGEVTYLSVNSTNKRGFWRRSLVDWKVEQHDTMPEQFARRPLVILHDGQWYADANPSE